MAGFCLQQALEKFLKAFLLSKGWNLRRIHNLDARLDDTIEYDSTLEEFRGVCQKVTVFYISERYPFVIESGITKKDVLLSLDESNKLIKRLRNKTIKS